MGGYGVKWRGGEKKGSQQVGRGKRELCRKLEVGGERVGERK